LTWICLVDDEPEVCDVLTEALRAAGHGVQSFRDGSDALEAVETALEPPRLVILDVLLRHMSGREVLRRLRVGRRVPDVPVLVITGMDVDEAYFAPWPILGVLRKPIAVEELLATVARAMRPRRRRR
jgi:two-component system OmpR family response regulator